MDATRLLQVFKSRTEHSGIVGGSCMTQKVGNHHLIFSKQWLLPLVACARAQRASNLVALPLAGAVEAALRLWYPVT